MGTPWVTHNAGHTEILQSHLECRVRDETATVLLSVSAQITGCGDGVLETSGSVPVAVGTNAVAMVVHHAGFGAPLIPMITHAAAVRAKLLFVENICTKSSFIPYRSVISWCTLWSCNLALSASDSSPSEDDSACPSTIVSGFALLLFSRSWFSLESEVLEVVLRVEVEVIDWSAVMMSGLLISRASWP